MMKTISAALLAVSVLAAPAFAATSGKTAQAPVTKSAQAKIAGKTSVKPNVLNANAKMGHRHASHYKHHRHHAKKIGALKTHTKISSRHAAPTIKRG